MNVDNEPGVILHSRPFTDSKKILNVLTPSYGRFNLVARHSRSMPLPKAFAVFSLSWLGKADLKTLRQCEELVPVRLTQGRPLFCGMYLNELCARVLPEYQAQGRVYEQYIETIDKLSGTNNDQLLMEVLLRRFEFSLLASLGLAINFEECADGHQISRGDNTYFHYDVEHGFRRCLNENMMPEHVSEVFRADDIACIRKQEWSADALKSAKKLSRIAFRPLLGERPLKSRELFT